MGIIKVKSDHSDFIRLTNQLDGTLQALDSEENGGERLIYESLNQLENLSWALLLYDDTRPIGCAAIKKHDEKTAEVKRVFVSDLYRGKGLARRLLAELEKEAMLEGYRHLILETGKRNVAAITMYQKLHYQRIDNYAPYDKMSDSVCMKKELISLK